MIDFFFLSSLIFAAGVLRLFFFIFFPFYMCISLSRQQPFYFHKEHKLMGKMEKKKKLYWSEKQMSKKGLFKVAHRGIRIAGSGARKMEDNTIEV